MRKKKECQADMRVVVVADMLSATTPISTNILSQKPCLP